eukprot:Opistho-2@96000
MSLRYTLMALSRHAQVLLRATASTRGWGARSAMDSANTAAVTARVRSFTTTRATRNNKEDSAPSQTQGGLASAFALPKIDANSTIPSIPIANSVKVVPTPEAGVIHDGVASPTVPTSPVSVSDEKPHRFGVMWFDNIFPIQIHRWDIRAMFIWSNSRKLDALLKGLVPEGVTITQVVPRMKDGGAFVHFDFCATQDVNAVYERIINYLKRYQPHTRFSSQEIRAHPVRGTPFLEDMLSRYPSNVIRIDYTGPPLQQELLFAELRPYGKIYDITPSPFSKDAPPYAIVRFKRMHGATSARNCFHGVKVNNTSVAVSYEAMLKTSAIKDFITKHPRIFVPAIGVVVGATTYVVFDPIRAFFIKNKLTHRFEFDWSQVGWLNWIRSSEALNRLMRKTLPTAVNTWSAREADELRVKARFKQEPDAVIFLAGPKGTGKTAIVQKAIKDKRYSISINLEQLSGRTEEEFLSKLAKTVGFFPAMTSLLWARSAAEAAVAALSGQKPSSSGSSSLTSQQVAKILECLTNALADISQVQRSLPPDQRDYPVLVIDGFSNENREAHEKFFDTLAVWAAGIAANHICHVVFVSDHAFAEEAINTLLGERKVDTIILSDASHESAVDFVRKNLPECPVVDADDAIRALGGRFSDLEALIRKVEGGKNINDAVDEIIQQAAVEIRKVGLGEDKGTKVGWSKTQFWSVVQRLAADEEVPYDEIRFSTFFKGDDAPLRAMFKSDLLSLNRESGTVTMLRPGRPVFREAFKQMLADPRMAGGLGVLSSKQLIEEEQKKIDAYEIEIGRLASLAAGSWVQTEPAEIQKRRKFLLGLLSESHDKMAKYEAERRQFETLLKTGAASRTSPSKAGGWFS